MFLELRAWSNDSLHASNFGTSHVTVWACTTQLFKLQIMVLRYHTPYPSITDFAFIKHDIECCCAYVSKHGCLAPCYTIVLMPSNTGNQSHNYKARCTKCWISSVTLVTSTGEIILFVDPCVKHFADERSTFTSPNYPSEYPSNIRCQWHFNVGRGTAVLKIQNLHLEGTYGDCTYDYLQV